MVRVRSSGDLDQRRAAAIALGRGGVGYYPGADFVRLDTGRVRTWGPRTG
jgi:uncharacterized protein YcbK (DUF882 family)